MRKIRGKQKEIDSFLVREWAVNHIDKQIYGAHLLREECDVIHLVACMDPAIIIIFIRTRFPIKKSVMIVIYSNDNFDKCENYN